MSSVKLNLCQKIASVSAVLLGFSLPISTGLDSVLLAILLLTALLGWHRQYPALIAQNRVAQLALLLFGILLIACFYGAVPPVNSLKVLTKYDDLILVALLLPIFAPPAMRRYGLSAFMAAMMLTLLLSYLIWLGVFQHTALFPERMPSNPVVFKLYLTHGILMGFAAFMFAVHAAHAHGKKRLFMWGATLLALCNVLLMTQGRTGYLIVLALGIYFMTTLLRTRNLLLGILLIIAASALVYTSSPNMQARIDKAAHEAQVWHPKQGNNMNSSIGTRLDYYTNTLSIIQKNPWLGVGTGGFETAYNKEIEGSAVAHSNNPHNQFLLFWAQTGIVGLLAFFALLWTTWRTASHLPERAEVMLARGLLITITVGCLFNSLLLDHTEGLLFAWLSGLLFAGLSPHKKPI